MNRLIRYVVAKTYQPLLVRYLSHTRTYSYKNIRLQVPSEVFHPGFFYSTHYLLQYIDGLQLQQKTFLELGAGSGLIAMYAAKKNAYVTASDINPTAIEYLGINQAANGVNISVVHSDMFSAIPRQAFDIIAINPPYYKKDPVLPRQYAWYCGENGEYFQKLFRGIGEYTHPDSTIVMTLCDGCDITMIHSIAKENKYSLRCVVTKQNLVENHFIYKIERLHEN